jgi:hypothetical protein
MGFLGDVIGRSRALATTFSITFVGCVLSGAASWGNSESTCVRAWCRSSSRGVLGFAPLTGNPVCSDEEPLEKDHPQLESWGSREANRLLSRARHMCRPDSFIATLGGGAPHPTPVLFVLFVRRGRAGETTAAHHQSTPEEDDMLTFLPPARQADAVRRDVLSTL